MRSHIAAIPEEFREPFETGQDIWKFLAARVLGVPKEQVTREQRQRMKECCWLWFKMRGPEILTEMIQGEEQE